MAEASETEVPRLTAANFVQKVPVGGERDWRRLGVWLKIPESTLRNIRGQHSDDRRRMAALISHWLKIDPTPSWRRLIVALDDMRHQTADSIRQYAEPLTDSTLTLCTVTKAVAPVQDWNVLALRLGVPGRKLDGIRIQHTTNEKRKESAWCYWISYCPVVSWGKLAGELHRLEENKSLKNVKKYLKKTTEPTLTLTNLCQALARVENWHGFSEWLCVPSSKQVEIIQKSPSDDVKVKREILHQFLTAHPAPSWQVIFEGLYQRGQDEPKCHTILQEVGSCYGREMVLPPQPLDTKRSVKRQFSKSSAIEPAPLLFLFPDGHGPPIGIFISLVNFLLSSENHCPCAWELHCSDGSPTCMHQNCVKFAIPNFGGSVSFIKSSSYFEAHVTIPETELCHFVREAIFTGLKKFSSDGVDNLRHARSLPEIAFECPCKAASTHAATIGANGKLICVNNSEKWRTLQPNQSMWLTEQEQPIPRTRTFSLDVSRSRRKTPCSLPPKAAATLPRTDSGKRTSVCDILVSRFRSKCTPSMAAATVPDTDSGTFRDDAPTLPEVINFQGPKGSINIPQEIGVRYMAFGALLLDDRSGMRIRSIESEKLKNAENINTEVFQRWMGGEGKQPVTWDTLVDVLRAAKLATLAKAIAAVNCK